MFETRGNAGRQGLLVTGSLFFFVVTSRARLVIAAMHDFYFFGNYSGSLMSCCVHCFLRLFFRCEKLPFFVASPQIFVILDFFLFLFFFFFFLNEFTFDLFSVFFSVFFSSFFADT